MNDKPLFDAIREIKGSSLTQSEVDRVNAAMGKSPAPKRISDAGKKFIEEAEGLRLKAYQDSVGVWTIGYGHTDGVKAGQVITQARAEELLSNDLERFEAAVRAIAPKTTQGQFDAFVSFAFNLGEGALARSTLLKLHNAGNYQLASMEFSKWVNADGHPLPGLVKRRAGEAKMYRGSA